MPVLHTLMPSDKTDDYFTAEGLTEKLLVTSHQQGVAGSLWELSRFLETPSHIRARALAIKSTTSKFAAIPTGRYWCTSTNPPRLRMANGKPRRTIKSQQGSRRRTSIKFAITKIAPVAKKLIEYLKRKLRNGVVLLIEPSVARTAPYDTEIAIPELPCFGSFPIAHLRLGRREITA
jgi:hypothetical protein